ncbi:hypothetical protein ACLMJK_003264 [Lecanora helva]
MYLTTSLLTSALGLTSLLSLTTASPVAPLQPRQTAVNSPPPNAYTKTCGLQGFGIPSNTDSCIPEAVHCDDSGNAVSNIPNCAAQCRCIPADQPEPVVEPPPAGYYEGGDMAGPAKPQSPPDDSPQGPPAHPKPFVSGNSEGFGHGHRVNVPNNNEQPQGGSSAGQRP